MNEQDIKWILNDNKAGKYVSNMEGTLGGMKVYEVLVSHDDEVKTRYVAESPNANPQFFPHFGALCQSLDPQSSPNVVALSQIQRQKFNSYVAACAFLLTVSAAIYIITTQNEIKFAVVPFFLGLIASGGAFFFGRWIMPRAAINP